MGTATNTSLALPGSTEVNDPSPFEFPEDIIARTTVGYDDCFAVILRPITFPGRARLSPLSSAKSRCRHYCFDVSFLGVVVFQRLTFGDITIQPDRNMTKITS